MNVWVPHGCQTIAMSKASHTCRKMNSKSLTISPIKRAQIPCISVYMVFFIAAIIRSNHFSIHLVHESLASGHSTDSWAFFPSRHIVWIYSRVANHAHKFHSVQMVWRSVVKLWTDARNWWKMCDVFDVTMTWIIPEATVMCVCVKETMHVRVSERSIALRHSWWL